MSELKDSKNGIEPLPAQDLSGDELDKWIKEQFFKDAEAIEKEIESIPEENFSESGETGYSEEKFQEVLSKVKAKGLIKEDSGFSTNVDDRYKIKSVKRENHAENRNRKLKSEKLKRSVIKWTAFAAVTAFGIFGVTMTSEANRAYIMEEVNKLFGNDVNTKINNDKVLDSDRTEEYAREDVENTLGIKMPRFYYIPTDLVYESYALDEEAQTGILQYSYEERAIFFVAISNEKNASVLSQSDMGKKIETIPSEMTSDLDVTLWEIQEEDDREPEYSIRWEYRNSYYELFGKISEQEIKNIAKKIMY